MNNADISMPIAKASSAIAAAMGAVCTIAGGALALMGLWASHG